MVSNKNNGKDRSSKEDYFTLRVERVKNSEGRAVLAEREVRTLMTVLDLSDHENCLAGMHVADLGCGDQYLKKSFEKRGASYRGVDVDECDFEVDSLPLANESCDIVVSMSVIEHLRDPGNFLSEVKRILKDGSALWMDTPDIQACGGNFWNDPTHVHPYTRVSIKMLLEMSGYKDVLVTPNYRCKPKHYYTGESFSFFRARHLMPFAGMTEAPVPEFMKGHCSGLFVLGRKGLD